jgi:hypothetical protein
MKYSESPTTIEHNVEANSHSQATGGASTMRVRAPVGQAYAPRRAEHTNILSTLELHKARAAIGRMAIVVKAQASALPIAINSPKVVC